MAKINRHIEGGMEIEDYVLTATEKEAAKMERPLEKKWANFLWYGMLILMVILISRVFYLTIIKGVYYQEISKGNSVRSIVIKAPRGKIFDRYGTVLVNNVPSVNVVIIPANLSRDNDEVRKIVLKLSDILKMENNDIILKIESSDKKSFNPILLKENISQDEMLAILENAEKLSGIRVEKTAIRSYVDSSIFSHILGYEGKIEKKELEDNPEYSSTDHIGKQGIEKSYEKQLRGIDGASQVEVDSLGSARREIGIISPKPGNDLILTIDAELQKKLYDTLLATLEKNKIDARTAAAVAIDPRNGEVLALVNLPSFDNNLFAQKISVQDYSKLVNDSSKPLFNRAISGEYAPGSTIKPIIAAGALNENVINPDTIINGLGGVLRIGNFSFGDWKAHGPSDVRTAIAESNDIFFYTIGGGYGNIAGLGIEKMKKYYNMFGFGEKTGVDIPGESIGFVPDEKWKQEIFGEKWYVGNSYHASIGQGYITSTPIQIANYVAAIANGGMLFQPQVVSQVRKNNGEIANVDHETIRKIDIPKNILDIVREGMKKTITDGTAQQLKDLPVEVAGKTGTAQFGNEDKTHAWFVSFAPYDNPQIAMAIIVEGGGEGSSSSVPVTKEVYNWYFSREAKNK